MAKKDNLVRAKKNKNDEFYTKREEIERELKNYKNHFKNKIVFCNCDDPEYSNFYFFFKEQFNHLNLKKLITTHYNKEGNSYKLEICRDSQGRIKEPKKVSLLGDGDFRSNESIELLKESDIIVTNPPFSLFREYVSQLIEYDKKFLIIGHQNAISYKEIFKLIKENKLWLGINGGSKEYEIRGNIDHLTISRIDDKGKKFTKMGNTHWFTNLDHSKRHEFIDLWSEYDAELYPKYENYDAINVDESKNIPKNYFEPMGVPITFLDKINPEQFEILAIGIVGSIEFTKRIKMEILKNGKPTGRYTINAKGTLYKKYNPKIDKKPPAFKDCETGELYSSIYARMIIRNKGNKNGN